MKLDVVQYYFSWLNLYVSKAYIQVNAEKFQQNSKGYIDNDEIVEGSIKVIRYGHDLLD